LPIDQLWLVNGSDLSDSQRIEARRLLQACQESEVCGLFASLTARRYFGAWITPQQIADAGELEVESVIVELNLLADMTTLTPRNGRASAAG